MKVRVVEKNTAMAQVVYGEPKTNTVYEYKAVSEASLASVVREISDHYGLRIAQKKILTVIENE